MAGLPFQPILRPFSQKLDHFQKLMHLDVWQKKKSEKKKGLKFKNIKVSLAVSFMLSIFQI